MNSNSCKNQFFNTSYSNLPTFYSPKSTGRIYMTYKSPQAIYNEKPLQTSNLFEKCKRDRQTIQQLTQTMNNRVQLLSYQEAKSCKNIDQNKKIAQKLWQSKNRTEIEKKQKLDKKKQQEEELLRQKQRIQQMRAQQKEENLKVRCQLWHQKQKEQQEIKEQRKKNELLIKNFNSYMQQNNQSKIMQIHEEYALGNQRIEQFVKNKKSEVIQNTQRRVKEELFRRTQLEKEFKQFEEQEVKQLEKLHRTQQSEHAINQQLSDMNAIPISPTQYQQKFYSEFKSQNTEGKENNQNFTNKLKTNESLQFEKELDMSQNEKEENLTNKDIEQIEDKMAIDQ